MDAGDLDRRVLIRRWQDQPDQAFGIEQTFDQGIPAWANIVPAGNAVFFGAKQVGEDVTHRITVRRRADLTDKTVTAEHVVEAEGYRYRVRRASALKGGRTHVVLDVELLGAIT
ncbi:Phage head-tail joining protein [compost metagenome]